jgi:hypothetical protein
MNIGKLSRRDFLKLGGSSLLGLLLSGFHSVDAQPSPPVCQGRVVYNSLILRDFPAFSGKKIRSCRRDSLLVISESLFGGTQADYNRTWFRVGSEGYVYSGGVQPVRTELNAVVMQIPERGVIGEITVPYTDSVWAVNRSPSPGPRLYYATTHWVDGLVVDGRDGSLWYKAYDNLYNSHYHIRPECVRILPAAETAPLSPQVSDGDKYMEIILDRQLLVAFEYEQPVFAARVATGQPNYETPLGWFQTFHKRPTYHMTGGADETTMFDLPGVPWDSYITDTGVAIHGTYWHNDFGHPHSHGCINMTPQDARWVYRWSLPGVPPGERMILDPGVGTRVQVVQSWRPRSSRRE